jgi:hypothetical protein
VNDDDRAHPQPSSVVYRHQLRGLARVVPVFVFAHDLMQRIHGTWFHLSREQFDALHYAGMAVYKVGILLFNLVPLTALFMRT